MTRVARIRRGIAASWFVLTLLLPMEAVGASACGDYGGGGGGGTGGAAPRAATDAPRSTVAPRSACCRTCTTGKACGNSCIARNLTCHQPTGCACDAR